jgi:hypothetical protein
LIILIKLNIILTALTIGIIGSQIKVLIILLVVIVLLVVLGEKGGKEVGVPVLGEFELLLVHLSGVAHLAFTLVGVELAVEEGLDVLAFVVVDELFQVHEGDAHFHDLGKYAILLLPVLKQPLLQRLVVNPLQRLLQLNYLLLQPLELIYLIQVIARHLQPHQAVRQQVHSHGQYIRLLSE